MTFFEIMTRKLFIFASFHRNQRNDYFGVTSPAIPAVVPRGDKDAIINSIMDSYRNHAQDHEHKKTHKTKKISKFN